MDLLSLVFAIYLQSTLFIFSFNCCYNCSTVSRFLFAIITYNISDLFRENTNNFKNGEEAHNETIRAYGAMGFLRLD